MPIENDAVDDNGCPVLFACTCGLPRIKRFDTALRLQSGTGRLICFDFQMDALRKCCEDRAQFQTIGLKNGKEVLSIRRKRLFSILSGLPPLLFALLYGGGYIAQFIRNHTVWKNAGGTPGYGTAPEMPSFILSASFEALFTLPYGGLSAASYVSACWCCSLSWLCGWDMGTLENTIRNGILSISKKELTEHRVLCLKRKRRKC